MQEEYKEKLVMALDELRQTYAWVKTVNTVCLTKEFAGRISVVVSVLFVSLEKAAAFYSEYVWIHFPDILVLTFIEAIDSDDRGIGTSPTIIVQCRSRKWSVEMKGFVIDPIKQTF